MSLGFNNNLGFNSNLGFNNAAFGANNLSNSFGANNVSSLSGLGNNASLFGGFSNPLSPVSSNNLASTDNISMPATTSALLGHSAQALAQKFLSGGERYGYSSTGPYSSSLISPGLSMVDIFGSIAANTLPLIDIQGRFGYLVQSMPQLFQILTGSVAAFRAWRETENTPPEPNTISPVVQEAMNSEDDLDKWFYGDDDV